MYSALMLLLVNSAVLAVDPLESQKTAAKTFVEAMDKGDWEKASLDFESNLKKAVPSEKLPEVWKSVKERYGELTKITGMRHEKIEKTDRIIVQCDFKKGKLDIAVNFDAKGKIIGFLFQQPKGDYKFEPPPYVKKDQFTETAVKVGAGATALPGTLTLPTGKGPFPVVILVHGSGGHDRDETLGPNKPFRDLAWGLAMQGIASLRYDKRTSIPEKMNHIKMEKFTLKEEVMDDVLQGFLLLRGHTSIDRKKIFVLGHSLGGMATPRLLTLEPGFAGGILLAGNQRQLTDLVLEQLKYLEELAGKNLPAEHKKEMDRARAEITLVKEDKMAKESPEKLYFNAPAAYWVYLKEYDQGVTAAKLKQPLLILQGERDYQVTMTDFDGWKKALADKKNVEYKSYAKLNHLFMTGEGKPNPVDYTRAGYVDSTVIDDIAQWLKKQ